MPAALLCFCLLALLPAVSAGAERVQVVKYGRSDYVIAQSARPTEAETTAAKELADFIRRSTGTALPIVAETGFKGGKAIYVGQTKFAGKQGIDFVKLAQEEWTIRGAGANLVICGGRPRGTLYGVYAFLERFVGVRFPDADTEFVPRRATLTVPADVSLQESPAFWRREIYMVASRDPQHVRFQVRRRMNSFAVATRSPGPEWGYSVRFGSRLHNFVDLEYYLATALLQNPQQDENAVIDEFMDLYYGPAAPVMKRFLDYLERRQEEQPGCLATVPPSARRYFDAAFFRETDAMLGEAEARVAGDAKRLADVRQERLAIDETMLHLWNPLNKQWPLPLARETVLERLRQSYQSAYRKYGGWGEASKRQDETRLAYLRNMPPIPREFADKKIIDVCGPQLHLESEAIARRVDDPHAACGKAWRLDASLRGSPGDHAKAAQLGLYDNQTKLLVKQIVAAERVPKDEQYHLHLAGRMKATSSMYFWAHHSWRLSQRLQMSYDSSLPEQKTYDVYASVKLEGPAYVPGSTKTNAFSIDRIILVEVPAPDAAR